MGGTAYGMCAGGHSSDRWPGPLGLEILEWADDFFRTRSAVFQPSKRHSSQGLDIANILANAVNCCQACIAP